LQDIGNELTFRGSLLEGSRLELELWMWWPRLLEGARVFRGGSWWSVGSSILRATDRSGNGSTGTWCSLGFQVVVPAPVVLSNVQCVVLWHKLTFEAPNATMRLVDINKTNAARDFLWLFSAVAVQALSKSR